MTFYGTTERDILLNVLGYARAYARRDPQDDLAYAIRRWDEVAACEHAWTNIVNDRTHPDYGAKLEVTQCWRCGVEHGE